MWTIPFSYGKLNQLERSDTTSVFADGDFHTRFIEESSLFPAVLDAMGALVGSDGDIFTSNSPKEKRHSSAGPRAACRACDAP